MSFLQLRGTWQTPQILFFPTVTTQAATSVADTTATGNGTVVNIGGSSLTERGVVVSTSINPTIADSKFVASGTTTGAFTASITGLSPSTVYYCRAYATNAIGTAYGDNVSFTTTGAVGSGSHRYFFLFT